MLQPVKVIILGAIFRGYSGAFALVFFITRICSNSLRQSWQKQAGYYPRVTATDLTQEGDVNRTEGKGREVPEREKKRKKREPPRAPQKAQTRIVFPGFALLP